MRRRAVSILFVSCMVAGALVSCGYKSGEPGYGRQRDSTRETPQPTIRSTKTLKELLVPGMSTNEIVARFGQPCWTLDSGGAVERWHYSLPVFPADDEMEGNYVDGFLVTITNGHLAHWGCSYFSRGYNVRREEVFPVGDGNVAPESIKMFVVSEDPIADGRLIDDARFPKLGYIPQSPSFMLSRLKKVILEERVSTNPKKSGDTVWSFVLFLGEEDSERFAAFTASNVSKRVLIMVGDEPVAAPIIRAPLQGGSFCIDCTDKALVETIKARLSKMPQQGR